MRYKVITTTAQLANGIFYPDHFEVKDGILTLIVDGRMYFVDVNEVISVSVLKEPVLVGGAGVL